MIAPTSPIELLDKLKFDQHNGGNFYEQSFEDRL